MAPSGGRGYNAAPDMNLQPRSSRDAAGAALLDPDLLRSRSILIYCRSSIVLSVLVFLALLAKIYSDLYLHLIRQTARTLARASVPPGFFFLLLLLGALFLAVRVKPRLEKAALLILAANLAVFLLRRKTAVHTDVYYVLCGISLLLDLGLLGTVVAFYRRYPNVLKVLRSSDVPADDRRVARTGKNV